MAFYSQKKCPYCGKFFTDTDDVVVCPDCGTPHHRACWVEHGTCAFADRHGQMPPEEPAAAQPTPNEHSDADFTDDDTTYTAAENKLCPRCGYRNRQDAAFCSGCGLAFSDQGDNPFRASNGMPFGFDPSAFNPDINFSSDADFEDVPAADMVRLVGKNTLYYLPVFSRLRAMDRSRFHFCALLFGGGWMLYRKQYVRGAITLAIQLLLQALQMVALFFVYLPMYIDLLAQVGVDYATATVITPEQAIALTELLVQSGSGAMFKLMLPLIIGFISIVYSVVIGFKANAWYYRDTLRKGRKLRAMYTASEEQLAEEETARGGVNMPLGICLLVCGSILQYAMNYLPLFFQ